MNKQDLMFYSQAGMVDEVHAVHNEYANCYTMVVKLKSTDKHRLYCDEESVYFETARGDIRDFRTFESLRKMVNDCGINKTIEVHTLGFRS